ncbi:MAG TPA: hypothetical protein VFY27_04910, partial [Woeseiaceae bacterium]|nr:hypothetical protein [Woeseiaceae bacterium]
MNLLIGLPTMTLCLFLQSALFVVALRYYSRHESLVNDASWWSALIVINGVMTLLVVGNLIQLTIWAVVFMMLGEFEELAEAVY